MNYKEIDTQRIIDYIGTFANGVSVDDIILHSGADKLRVYPALLVDRLASAVASFFQVSLL